MQTQCAKCQKSIEVPRWRLNRYKKRSPNKNFYCSRECYLTGRQWFTGIDHPRWKGGDKKTNCENCFKEFSYKRAYKRKARFCSSKCWGKWWKKQHKKIEKRKKKSNPIRGTKLYTEWRNVVLQRDGYKCITCGQKEILIAHHLISIKARPEMALDTKNGITLCIQCHDKIHYSK